MNIAFPALLILILVLPGSLFFYFYRKGSWTSPVSFTSLPQEFVSGLIFSPLIHFVWIKTIYWLQESFIFPISLPKINYAVIVSLINSSSLKSDIAVSSIANYPFLICFYFTGVSLFGVILGFLTHKIVRKTCLDHLVPSLRFKNEWYYMLKCEAPLFMTANKNGYPWDENKWFFKRIYAKFKCINNLKKSSTGAYVSIVILQGNDSYLYRGILTNFFFDKKGKLSKLVLEKTYRRLLEEDQKEIPDDEDEIDDNKHYYPVRGDYFIIIADEVSDINIEYFTLEEKQTTDSGLDSYEFTQEFANPPYS